MTKTRPQRTVSIAVSGNHEDDAQVSYTYWSPHDGILRTASPSCDLYQEGGTNTLFVLDYPSTLAGWTVAGTEPNPSGAPSLETRMGPANGSLMTEFPATDRPEIFRFYILYDNIVTGARAKFDPQEGNVPP